MSPDVSSTAKRTRVHSGLEVYLIICIKIQIDTYIDYLILYTCYSHFIPIIVYNNSGYGKERGILSGPW